MKINTSSNATQSAEEICILSQPDVGYIYLGANAGDTRDMGSIHGSGRSPGGGHGNSL